jgi:hypothetical protein
MARPARVRRAPPGLPWARPRYEVLLLALVAIAALSPAYGVDTQDQSRLCLTQALVHGRVSNDACFSVSRDRAGYGAHLYSDKAPGLSLLEVPAAEAVRLEPVQEWADFTPETRIWAVRVFSAGVAFLVCAFLVGRVSEGIAAGYGAISLVAFALGTLVAPLAAANFDHVPAATLGFGTFLLAWGRRPLAAGLAAGALVLVEYEAALITIAVAAYVALGGLRALGRYAAGVVPGILLLGAYNWAAFDAPWHFSYDYVGQEFAQGQSQGLFGIALPTGHGVHDVFWGSHGLLVNSPILVAAAWGLWLLGRRYGTEAALCAIVALAYVLINCGYYLPYGGVSPGPRFLVAGLPFLAVGLAPAFERVPRLTTLLAVASILATMAVTVVWANDPSFDGTVWSELGRFMVKASRSTLAMSLSDNALGWLGPSRGWGAGIVALAALSAIAFAVPSSVLRLRARAR